MRDGPSPIGTQALRAAPTEAQGIYLITASSDGTQSARQTHGVGHRAAAVEGGLVLEPHDWVAGAAARAFANRHAVEEFVDHHEPNSAFEANAEILPDGDGKPMKAAAHVDALIVTRVAVRSRVTNTSANPGEP